MGSFVSHNAAAPGQTYSICGGTILYPAKSDKHACHSVYPAASKDPSSLSYSPSPSVTAIKNSRLPPTMAHWFQTDCILSRTRLSIDTSCITFPVL